ncbi:MAG: aldo/keto reductase [Hylemonella sp.]|nr:aldo/keto reductase [Hylemonella sp.]
MDKRPDVSKICFGCEPLGGADWGEVDVIAIAGAVERALELGVNFFDTADVYGLGLSETRLSEILGPRRHDVVIATKGGMSWQHSTSGGRATIRRDSSPEYLRGAVEASLRRLRIDSIPIYFIHWPDPNTEIATTFECLSRLRDEGKIGQIGCSNFSATQVRAACDVAEVSYVQLPLNLLDGGLDPDMDELVREKSIGVVAYNVLANGLLTGKYDASSRFPVNDRRSRLPRFQGDAFKLALRQVADISLAAAAEGLTCAQYAITKVLERAGVVSVILGIKNRQQIEENCWILSRP